MEEKDRLEFAKLMIEHVRDDAIQACDVQLRASHMDGKSKAAIRYREAIANGESSKLAEMVITDSIDEALFRLFYAIDNGLITLAFKNSEGKLIELADDGEWAGWYVGEWRYNLSKERCDHDLDDLKLD